MIDGGETYSEKVRAKAAGLEPWFRARLLNGLTRLFLVLLIPGGLVVSQVPERDMLVTATVCVSICTVIAVVMTVRILLILRELRKHPERAVIRLTKWRKLQKAGFTPLS
jgi:NhaP-type Na+/H+ or K+/H+ antiporter